MRKFTVTTVVSAISLAVFLSCILSLPTSAIGIMDGVQAAQGNDTPSTLFGGNGVITTITNVMLFLIGALSVIMIIIGGIRYTISGGNSANVTAAKNTIMYALVGLIVAFLAFAIVNFVLGSIGSASSGGSFDFADV